MLDYKKLRKEFKEVLSKIGEAEIESWLKFDEERMMNESIIKGEKVIIKVGKFNKTNFNNLDSSISIVESDEFNIAA